MKLNKRPSLQACRLFTCTLLSTATFQVIADDGADDELFFEMPVVLSANRLEQPVAKAAVSVTVIDRETIVASGARTIPEVLRLVPGMQVGFSGNEFGDEPMYVVTYHGHSDQYSRQMQVLIDGRSIYQPFFGGVNWKSIPVNMNDIERIEVSRGPNMATYGSNSFQAAINIITRTAAEDQGSFIQSNVGSNGVADLTYRYGGNSGDLDYRLTLSTFNDDGLDSGNDFDYPNDTQSNNFDYRLDYQIDHRNTLSYQGGYGENEQQADRNHEDVLPVRRLAENTHFFQFLKWENVIDNKNTLLVQYYYNLSDKVDESVSDSITIPPFDTFTVDVNGNIKSERHNLELTHFYYPDENLKLVWGLSAQSDYVKAPLYLGSNDKINNNQYRGFANLEWHLNQNNTINIGALIEDNDFTESDISPRLSFTHAFNRQHSIRFGISQAIRSPFIYEAEGNLSFSKDITIGGTPVGQTLHQQLIFGGIPGQSNLTNEKIISRELAYYANLLDSTLLFNARLFTDDITGYITTGREDVAPLAPEDNLPDDPGDPNSENTVQVFHNIVDSTTSGLEIELDYHINPSFRLITSGAIINIQSESESLGASAPQHSYSILLTKRFNEKYNGSLAYYYVDAFKWTDAPRNTTEFSTDKYQTIDMRLSRHFRFDKSRGSLSLVLKNLLDDYSDYQAEPRNASAPIAIQSTLGYIDFRMNF